MASIRGRFDELRSWGVLDVLVNNAGITVTRPALQQTEDPCDKRHRYQPQWPRCPLGSPLGQAAAGY